MGFKGIAAVAAGAMLLFSTASASDVRSTMTVSAYIAVAGSIDVQTTATASETGSAGTNAQQRQVAGEKIVAQEPQGDSPANCTSVMLICTGPASMRIKLRTDSEEVSRADPSSDVCAARRGNDGVLLCNAVGASAPTLLGVVIDY